MSSTSAGMPSFWSFLMYSCRDLVELFVTKTVRLPWGCEREGICAVMGDL